MNYCFRFRAARLTVRTFSIRRDQEIATHVSVRGAKAEEILNKALAVKEFELKARNFSATGSSRVLACLFVCSVVDPCKGGLRCAV